MRTWIISDLHLGHANIIKYCNRSFANVEEMNAYIIKQWNSTVSDDDRVINLGDLGFGFHKPEQAKLREDIKHLRGKEKILIKGNHDKRTQAEYSALGFQFKETPLLLDGIVYSHKPVDLNRYKGLATHNLHGHFHNNPVVNCEPELIKLMTPKHYLFILENVDYKPVLLDDILTHMG